jgi:fructose-bisphosphate aldolase class II
MVKINVGTILNVAFTRAIRERLAGDDSMVDPRTYLTSARDAVSDEVARLLSVLAPPTGAST